MGQVAALTPWDNPSALRYHEQGTALNRVLQEAPYLPRCSDNKTAAVVRPREYAIRWPYMQINRPGMTSWLIFDLDHANPLIWESAGLPAPNIIVTNRTNQHAHLFYAIVPVCTTDNARSAPIQFMTAIYEAMAVRLQADLAYRGPVAKTPGHPWWSTWEIHNRVLDLGELSDYVELVAKPRWRKEPNLDAVSHSRHCLLFEELRFFAYSIVNRERQQGSYTSFRRQVEAYANRLNRFRQRGFATDLAVSQVKSTVKSVSRWTWDKYQGGAEYNRGVMQLDKTLPLDERQRMAAKYTHQVRQKATEAKIQRACKGLLQRGEALTQKAIAAATTLSRQTVAKYAYIVDQAKTLPPTNVVNLKSHAHDINGVNYAGYQISASGFFRSAVLERAVKSVNPVPVQEELLVCLEPPDD